MKYFIPVLYVQFALLLMIPTGSAAQESAVHGTVRAAGTGAPIASAELEIAELGRVTSTDDAGYFVLPGVPEGRWSIAASAPGYSESTREVVVGAGSSVEVDFRLVARVFELPGVEVKAARQGLTATVVGPSATHIGIDEIEAMPVFAEADVLRAIQLLPSVHAISDFSTAPYVRGGTQDQNLILLDGLPLFNPYHFGGLFGALDPSTVESVNVLPGAFPARLGDRLSSAVEIRTRDGARDAVHGSGGIGLISSRASLSGPLPAGKGSYLVSGRRTYLDLATKIAEAGGLLDASLPYAFTDAYLKLVRDVGDAGRLTASMYVDQEGFDADEEVDFSGDANFSWGSRAAAVTYSQPLTPTLIGEVRLGVSTFGGDFEAIKFDWADSGDGRVSIADTLLNARTWVRDLLASGSLTWHARDHQLRAGMKVDGYLLEHAVQVNDGEVDSHVPTLDYVASPTTYATYLEDVWRPSGPFGVRAGLRVLHSADRGTAWLPRLAVEYATSPAVVFSVGAGRYAQVLASLRNEESLAASLMAYDFMGAVPVESRFSTSEDIVAGAKWNMGTTSVRMDAYAKWMHDLPLARLPADPVEAPILVPSDSFLVGSGSAKGFEVLARTRLGGIDLTAAYALAFAELTVGGESFRPRFNRRHTLDVLGAIPLKGYGEAGIRLTLASGQSYTPLVGILPIYPYDPEAGEFRFRGTGRFVLGEHNSLRLPGYFRLDLSARRDFETDWFGKDMTITPYISVLNALNSPNVLVAIPEGGNAYGDEVLNYLPQFPVVPTFGVEWAF